MPVAPVSPFSQFSMEDYDPNAPAPPPQMAAPAAPGAAPASPPSALQPMAGSSTPPQVFSPLDVAEKPDLARLQKLKEQDANPYGSASNHPGTMGKILHGLSIAGQIAGGVFAPHLMADIPGTEAYRNVHEQQLGKEINEIEREKVGNAKTAADAADATARAGQTIEQTKELPGKTAAEEGLQGAQTAEAGSRTALLDQQAKSLTQSSAPLDAHTAGALEGLYAPIKKQLGISQPIFTEGMPPALRDQAVAAMKELSALSEKQQEHADTVGMQKQFHADSESDKAATRALTASLGEQRIDAAKGKQDVALKSAAYKAYEPAVGSAERFNVMTQNYEDAIKNHNQQAMLSLLYNHLGMTMGLQKGARMTQSIIEEAQKSQPFLQGLRAKFDKDGYLSGVTLGPQQMRDMVSLAQDRYKEDVKSARAHGAYIGVADDGPTREPNAATINYYKALAGGDGQKAKAMAQADGWSVQ